MQGSSLIQVVLRNYQVRALLLEWTKTIITSLVCIFTCDLWENGRQLGSVRHMADWHPPTLGCFAYGWWWWWWRWCWQQRISTRLETWGFHFHLLRGSGIQCHPDLFSQREYRTMSPSNLFLSHQFCIFPLDHNCHFHASFWSVPPWLVRWQMLLN